MDATHFDSLAKAVSSVGTRRRLLGLLAALPLSASLAALLHVETAANRRQRKQRQQRQRDQAQERKQDQSRARGETCIPTGKQCPSKKPRGKKGKKLGCDDCCQGVAIARGRRKRVCGCVPVGESCASGGSAVCCSGVCGGAVCQRGGPPPPPPSPPPPPPPGCMTHDECGPDALCLDDGSCQACTVPCTGAPEDCGVVLQAALDNVAEGETIYVCPGLYQPVGPDGFSIRYSLSLIGAGEGENPLVDTLLVGGVGGRVLTVILFSGAEGEGEVTLRHLRLTGGDSAGSGGGINHFSGETLIVSDCTVTGNTAINGGGIYNRIGHTLELTRCTVRDNHAVNPGGINGGGGIFNAGTLTVTNCLIADNDATFGAGILTDGATTLTGDTVVRSNVAADSGGGIYVSSGTLDIDDPDCQVTLNTAPGGQGGGIFAFVPEDVTLDNVQIVTNNTGGNCEPEDAIDNCLEE